MMVAKTQKPLISRTSPLPLKPLSSSHNSQNGSRTSMFQSLEAMEREADVLAQAGQSRWMVPYADLLTLLLGLFITMFAAYVPQQQNKAPAQKPMITTPKAISSTPTLENSLRQSLHAPGMEILHQERGIVISLKDTILFAPGQAELSPMARKTLDSLMGRLSAAMKGKPSPIRIEGHTDNTPIATSQYPSNWELSTARATNIVRYLVAGGRWSPARISAVGYGQFRPLAENSSIEGKQKNRRVDIVILNEDTAHQEPPTL
jgi:chemotaxis protein MotB